MKHLLACALGLAAATSAIVPTAAQAQDLRPIMIQNNCYKPIRMWVNHADGWRNWYSHGTFNFAGYEPSLYLTANGVRLLQRDDHKLYFYAETTDGGLIWQGSYPTNVDGYSLPMREANYSVQYAAYHIQITC